MAYESGTFNSIKNLLEKIRAFLGSNGWTENLWADDTSGYQTFSGLDYTDGKRLHVKKQAADSTWMYFNFRCVKKGMIFGNASSVGSKMNDRYYGELRGIGINGSTGYDVGEKWDEQPGAPIAGVLSPPNSIGGGMHEIPDSGTNNYYIFQNGDTVIVMAEIYSGCFMYLGFGCLAKSGVYTGGQFYSASMDSYMPSYIFHFGYSGTARNKKRTQFLGCNWVSNFAGSGGIYLDIDGDADWRHSGNEGNQTTEKGKYIHFAGHCPYGDLDDDGFDEEDAFEFNSRVYSHCPNHFNGVAVLSPLYVFCKRATDRWSYIGRAEGVRVMNVSLYNFGDEMTIESDTWKIFPAYAKIDERAEITNLLGQVGFGFRKVT